MQALGNIYKLACANPTAYLSWFVPRTPKGLVQESKNGPGYKIYSPFLRNGAP